MNYQTKKAAVKKYNAMLTAGSTMDEIITALENDEKKFSQDDIDEIMGELEQGGEKEAPKASTKKGKVSTKPLYEEWSGRLKVTQDPKTKEITREFVKLEKLRSNIKITDHHAEVLNTGALSSDGTNPKMYFPQGGKG